METPNYFAIIPAEVRYDKRLKANEKLMYGEITCLTNKNSYCFASNKYFAELYEVTPQAISGWIKNLERCGYIVCEYLHNGTEIKERRIKVLTNSTKVEKGNSTKVEKGINKTLKGYKQNFKENNTSNNNININREREESSSDDFSLAKTEESQNEQNQTDEEETAKPKVVRHKYGQYQNVLLSDEQYQSLVNKHGPDKASWLIERLSEYIASSGRTYKNYLVTLNGWVLRAWEEEQKHNQNNNNNRAIINSVRNSLYGGMPDSANNDNSNDDNTFYF